MQSEIRPATDATIAEPTAGNEVTRDGVNHLSHDRPPAVAAALHVEETSRTHGFSTAVAVMSAIALGFVPAFGGRVVDEAAFIAALVLALVTSLIVRHRCADPRRYTKRVFRIFGFVLTTISFEVIYRVGVLSPAPIVLTLGVTALGLGLDRRFALAITVYGIAGYATLASLVVGGTIPDAGLIRTDELSTVAKIFGVVVPPVVLLITLGLARLSRRTLERAATDCHAALRLASQQEALLAEAHQNLDDALHVGVRRRGPWTGQLAGSWKLLEVVGSGAMGDVYAGRHTDTNEPAAVKILHHAAALSEISIERFEREGKITSALQSPNVVTVYETGRISALIPYLAMELLQGEDLARLFRRIRILPPAEVQELARQVACGLDAAHAQGIIHRDLKPQNLFRVGVDRWKILDFGVSTLAGSRGTLTQAALVGTPSYMAPEQARAERVDARCDVFALGAVLYRAIVGRQAFGAPNTPQVLFNVVYRMPPRPGELVDRIPPDVDSVLALALAKRRDDRFATAGELSRSLAAAYRHAIAPELRVRAELVLRKHPWGQAISLDHEHRTNRLPHPR